MRILSLETFPSSRGAFIRIEIAILPRGCGNRVRDGLKIISKFMDDMTINVY